MKIVADGIKSQTCDKSFEKQTKRDRTLAYRKIRKTLTFIT